MPLIPDIFDEAVVDEDGTLLDLVKKKTPPEEEGPDHETKFVAMMEIATRTEPTPEGMLNPDAVNALNLLAGLPEAQMSLENQTATLQFDPECDEPSCEECFGSEPPGPGWMYAGEGKWVRGIRRKKANSGIPLSGIEDL